MAKQPTAVPAVQGLADVYNATCVLRFLNAIQLLRGIDHSDDQRVVRADARIREFAAALLLGIEPAGLNTKDATDVLHLFHNIEPTRDAEPIFNGQGAHVGFGLTIEWVERSLRGKRWRQ